MFEPSATSIFGRAAPSPAVTERGERRRVQVLDATLQMIAERGYHNVRFQDVAQRSGASIGSIQYLFGSREALLLASFEHGVQQDLAYLSEITSGIEDPWARLVTATRELATDQAHLSDSRLRWLEFWRGAVRDERLAAAAERVYSAWRSHFETAIEEGIQSGRFEPTRRTNVIVSLLFAALDGVAIPILLKLPDGHTDEFADVLVDVMASLLGVQTTS
jgi:AcrR family transcriptional regulator